MHRRSISLFLLAAATTLTGCVSYDRAQGVKNVWRDESLAAPVIGKTTESDIIAALGPPSQVIGLRDQTVFYYLRERRKGDGAIFLLYNVVKENVTYDRAIYFFDKNGTLQDYGYSREKIAAPK